MADPHPNSTITMLIMGLGIVLYVANWWALVGFENDDIEMPWLAGLPAIISIVVGTASVIVIAIVLSRLMVG